MTVAAGKLQYAPPNHFPFPNNTVGSPITADSPNGGDQGSNSGGSDNMSNFGHNDQLSKTNLYIRGLKEQTTDDDLEAMCKEFGPIKSTKAIVDQQSNKCKGYGFVDFERLEDAESAVKGLKSKGYQAQMAKQQIQDPTNLYIANLPKTFTETDLNALCSKHGKVISTRILRDPQTRESRRVGFCRMENQEQCEKCVAAYNGMRLEGMTEMDGGLMVKLADCGNKKKSRLFIADSVSGSTDRTLLDMVQTQTALANGLLARNALYPPALYQPGAAAAAFGGWNGINGVAAATMFQQATQPQMMVGQAPDAAQSQANVLSASGLVGLQQQQQIQQQQQQQLSQQHLAFLQTQQQQLAQQQLAANAAAGQFFYSPTTIVGGGSGQDNHLISQDASTAAIVSMSQDSTAHLNPYANLLQQNRLQQYAAANTAIAAMPKVN